MGVDTANVFVGGKHVGDLRGCLAQLDACQDSVTRRAWPGGTRVEILGIHGGRGQPLRVRFIGGGFDWRDGLRGWVDAGAVRAGTLRRQGEGVLPPGTAPQNALAVLQGRGLGNPEERRGEVRAVVAGVVAEFNRTVPEDAGTDADPLLYRRADLQEQDT